jgi:uncharacterized metal-binding protein
MSNSCACGGEPHMILACSGGSNVGQLTNQAAVELTREGKGKMFCLIGVGAQLPGMVKAVEKAAGVVVLDGCAVGCARKAMENAGLPLGRYVVVTDLGIEKVKDQALALRDEDVATVKGAALGLSLSPKPAAAPAGCACSG